MKYMNLDQKGAVLAEYVWIDGSNGLRSKTKVSYDIQSVGISSGVRASTGGSRSPRHVPAVALGRYRGYDD